MLKKISKLNNFGSFSSFEADADLKEFQKYNLIWGLNGTGKTTLSRLFECINIGEIPSDFTGYLCNMQLAFENDINLTTFSDNAYKGKIRIFNQNFVDKNLSLDSENAKANGLTYDIGEGAIDIKSQISTQKITLENFYENNNGQRILKVEKEKTSKETELQNKFTNIANEIRADLGIQNANEYNKRHFENDYNRYSSEHNNIDEDEKQTNITKYSKPQKNNLNINLVEGISQNLLNEIKILLETKYQRDSSLREDVINWIETGLQYKENDICPFCKNNVSQARLAEIEEIIKKDDTFIQLEQNLTTKISLINNIISDLQNTNINNLRCEDFLIDISSDAIEQYKNIHTQYLNFLEDLLQKLRQKQESKDTTILINDNLIVVDYEQNRQNFLAKIQENNTAITNYEEERKNARTIIIGFYIFRDKEQIEALKTEFSNLTQNLDVIKEQIKNIEQTIVTLTAELSNQKAPIEEIEKYITIVFGHSRLKLEYDEETRSYTIKRDSGEIAKNLSEGEKTVIAFAYFLASLKSSNFDLSQAIVVIDDPVSSLDQQYLFNLLNLLMNKFAKPNTFKQLFVSTHNFYFFRKIRNILLNIEKSENNNRQAGADTIKLYELFKIIKKDTSRLVNADKYLCNYESEYIHSIKYLKDLLNNEQDDITDEHAGNVIRKVLEIFLAFRCPKEKGIYSRYQKIISGWTEVDKNSYKYLQDIANASSHTDECEDLDGLEEFKLLVGKGEVQQLFDFIKKVDEPHFNQLPR